MRIVCSLILSSLLSFQSQSPTTPPAQEAKDQQATQKPEVSLKQPLAFGLEDGTPIKLRLTRNLSSADATTGERVDFEVLEEVRFKDVLIVPRGGIAWATVTEAQHKRRMARGGKLDVNIDDVRLVDGERAPLRAVKEAKGGGHTGAMTGAIVATSIVFFPAAPLFLFMHGKDITIPKGTEITAYVNGDIPLDAKKFEPQPAATSDPAPATSPQLTQDTRPADTALATIDIKSTPDGADITVDGKFMGSTPSSLRLPAGDHQIKVEKQGFKSWERTLTVGSGGSTSLSATLERTN
jgi:hypothetical protein